MKCILYQVLEILKSVSLRIIRWYLSLINFFNNKNILFWKKIMSSCLEFKYSAEIENFKRKYNEFIRQVLHSENYAKILHTLLYSIFTSALESNS